MKVLIGNLIDSAEQDRTCQIHLCSGARPIFRQTPPPTALYQDLISEHKSQPGRPLIFPEIHSDSKEFTASPRCGYYVHEKGYFTILPRSSLMFVFTSLRQASDFVWTSVMFRLFSIFSLYFLFHSPGFFYQVPSTFRTVAHRCNDPALCRHAYQDG